jgi:hypothetical protein
MKKPLATQLLFDAFFGPKTQLVVDKVNGGQTCWAFRRKAKQAIFRPESQAFQLFKRQFHALVAFRNFTTKTAKSQPDNIPFRGRSRNRQHRKNRFVNHLL